MGTSCKGERANLGGGQGFTEESDALLRIDGAMERIEEEPIKARISLRSFRLLRS